MYKRMFFQYYKRFLCVALFSFVSLNCWRLIAFYQQDAVEIHFLNVGQGDAALIQYQGRSLVIDGGSHSEFDKGASPLLRFLRRRGIEYIDVMLLSHAHADHLGGLVDVMEALPVGMLIDPVIEYETKLYQRFLSLSKPKEIIKVQGKSGLVLKIGKGLLLEFFSPGEFIEGKSNLNNQSLVFKLSYEDQSILFTGDIEWETEKVLVERFKEKLKATVLKVAHHGSRTSSSQLFLKQVSPDWAVISCGEDNAYGFPHRTALRRLKRWCPNIYRTDEQGQVRIVFRDHSLRVDVHQDENVFYRVKAFFLGHSNRA
jgi:competence protein ComEC